MEVFTINEKVLIKLEEVLDLHDVLAEKTHELFMTIKLDSDKYDTSAIDCDFDFARHKRKTYRNILLLLETSFDELKVLELWDVRFRSLSRHILLLSEERIGTVLNVLRELWNDLYTDILRHQLTERSN